MPWIFGLSIEYGEKSWYSSIDSLGEIITNEK
jgi:hypothetical protein